MQPDRGPVFLDPLPFPKVWGGRRFPDPRGPVGEVWLASGLAEAPSPLSGGRGLTLDRAYAAAPEAYRGSPGPDPAFPLLLKAIDTADRLSVQVHPRRSGFSKTEAWYVLEAGEGAEILLGFRPGVSRADVEEALDGGRELASLLASHAPQPGSFYFVPPGTVHALGPGLVLLEVQEPRNVTYRLFDWNRPGLDGRPLHRARALEALSFETAAGPREGLLLEERPLYEERLLVDDSAFSAAVVRTERDVVLPAEGLSVSVVTRGSGRVLYDDGTARPVGFPDTFLTAAGSRRAVLEPGEGGVELLRARPGRGRPSEDDEDA